MNCSVSGFVSLDEESNYGAAEKSLKQALHQLSHLQKVWQDVLPSTVYHKAIGAMLFTLSVQFSSINIISRKKFTCGVRNNYKINHNNNNNRIQRCYSRFFTISSQCRKLSPAHMLKWPRGNCAQTTCNTLSAHQVQVSCYEPLGTKGQLSY